MFKVALSLQPLGPVILLLVVDELCEVNEKADDFLAQVDIGWAVAAGQDVPALLRQYGDRIETVHVKEFKPDAPAAVVGEGSVDWPALMGIMEAELDVQCYVVEQEQFEVGPLESAQGCIDNIRKMGR